MNVLNLSARIVFVMMIFSAIVGVVLFGSSILLMGYDIANSEAETDYEYGVVEVGVTEVSGEYIPYDSLDDGEKELVDDVVSSRGSVSIDSLDDVPVDEEGEHTIVMNDSGYVLEVGGDPVNDNEYEGTVIRLLISSLIAFGVAFLLSLFRE